MDSYLLTNKCGDTASENNPSTTVQDTSTADAKDERLFLFVGPFGIRLTKCTIDDAENECQSEENYQEVTKEWLVALRDDIDKLR